MEEDGYLKCQTCHRRFFSKFGFQIHYAKEHKTVTPTEDQENVKKVIKELTQDEEKVTTQSKLDFHINANKPEVCKIAEVVFDKKKSSTSQINKEQKARKTPVSQISEKILASATILKEPSKGIHAKLRPYHCQLCEQTFTYKRSLGHHILYML